MNKQNKKLIILSALFLAVIFVGSAEHAQASFWSDLWKGLTAPFTPSTSTTPTAPPVSLYQPTIDYENAVIAAVKKATPAVVSITISKNVPVTGQCQGANPFSDLPPEFQQFFGDMPQFTVPCDTGKQQLQEIGGGERIYHFFRRTNSY